MSYAASIGRAGVLLTLLTCTAGWAQDLALPMESEIGFRRFMKMAQDGELGADVDNANIGIDRSGTVRVELVRPHQENQVFLLRYRRSADSPSRYFDIEAQAPASAEDADALAAAIDQVFTVSPFRPAGVEHPADFEGPALGQAWRNGGWPSLLLAIQLQMTTLRSPGSTVAILLLLAAATLAALAALWLPPR